MIKPVYFGKGKDDKVLLDYLNGLHDFNFSDWVKEKIKEKMGINQIEIVEINTREIEVLIRKIMKEERSETITGDEKVNIETEIEVDAIDTIETKEDINLNGWTL